jgi:hypothetical protein
MNNQLEQNIKQLTEKKEALEQQVSEVEEQTPKRKVLAAMAKQKYFYLKEYPNVIFDRDTSYLWHDKELDITSSTEIELTGKNLADQDEVISLTNAIKNNKYLKLKGWEIPDGYDFRSIIDVSTTESKDTLPFLLYKNDATHYAMGRSDSYLTAIVHKNNNLYALSGWSGYDYGRKALVENVNGSQSTFLYEIIFGSKIDQNHNRYSIAERHPHTLCNMQFFLVNKSFALNEYRLDPSFDKLSEEEQATTLSRRSEQAQDDFLQILIQNKFIPIFENHKISPLYELLLNDLPKLHAELKDVADELSNLVKIKDQQRELLSSKFNYQELLAFNNFSCQDIDKSPIRFIHETMRWSDLLQEKVMEYQIRQHKVISEGNANTFALSRKYKDDKKLSGAENQLIASRQKFMFERLNLDMNIPMANLASMKLQCLDEKKKLFALNADSNGLVKLGLFGSEPRACFDLVAENSATMLTDVLLRIEFYEENEPLIKALLHAESEWAKDFKASKSVSKEKLKLECEEDEIDEQLWQSWFSEWCDKRWAIEKCLQPLIEKGLEGAFVKHNLDIQEPLVIKLVELLTTYRNKVDQFYLSDRKSVHQKFAFQTGGELQEKFEAESELYKHTISFQTKLHNMVFGLESIEERLWLFHWGDALVDMAIDSVLDFIRDKELDVISQAVINDFTQLRLQNYATFINDAAAHAEISAKWDKEYNTLMFKMRKELSQITAREG